MKSLKSTLFIFVAFLANIFTASATHFMGAQITYKSVGKYKYEIYLDFYRDCRGVPLGTPVCTLRVASSGATLLTPTLTLVSITDITPSCSKIGKQCYPTNTISSKRGIEKHSYKATVDLTTAAKNGVCQVQIGSGQCCRNGDITTGASSQNFWVWSMVDLCKWYKNSSPISYTDPITILKCNQPVYYNLATRDFNDNDSLVYEMVDAYQDWSQKTNWGSGFSYQSPLTAYCPGTPCSPSPKANPPQGFYLNRFNGDMIFTPTNCSESTVAAVRISEYHKDSATGKYVLVGYVTRDHQFWVMSMPDNIVPSLEGPDNIYFVDSSESRFKFSSADNIIIPKTGTPILNDTVKLTMPTFVPLQSTNASFSIIDNSAKNPSGIFKWKPLGLRNTKPYLLVLQARDNNCDYNAITHKAINVYVRKKAELAWVEGTVFYDANKNCKRDSFEYVIPGAKVSADSGVSVAFMADSTGYFGGWLPANTYYFGVTGKHATYVCIKSQTVAVGKTYSLELGGMPNMILSGTIYTDTLKNCKADSLEPRLKNQFVYTVPGNFSSSTDSKGKWELNIPGGDYKVIYYPKRIFTFVKCPSKPYNASIFNDTLFKNFDFAIYDSANITELSASLLTSQNYRRGFKSNATIVVKNNGSKTVSNAVIWVKFSKKLKYDTAFKAITKNDTIIKFSVPTLKTDEETTFKIVFKADTSTTKVNDTMTTQVWLDTSGLSKDIIKTNNYDKVQIKIVAAVDPNIKEEHSTNSYAWREGNTLRYFVQFQNTGTDTAVNITVIDTLHYALLGRTLNFLGASHAYGYTLNTNVLKVTFPNIYLVDTSKSKERSIGHFEYSIDINPLLDREIKFSNRADIYFDYATVVKTNKKYITYTSYVKTGQTNKNTYCGSDTLKVGYSSNFSFKSGNKFKLILSDKSGSFATGSKIIDSLSSTSATGNFKTLIPSGTTDGSLYKLKVVSTNPAGSVFDDALSNSFVILGNLTKPTLAKLDTLLCGKDSVQLTITSSYSDFKIYDRKTLIVSSGTNKKPKIKPSIGRHYLTVTASYQNCSISSDTLKFMRDTFPNISISSTSHSNLKVCGDDTVTLKVTGCNKFDLLGNSFAFIQSYNSTQAKVVIPNNGDSRSARFTGTTGCIDTSNVLQFTIIKRPSFTFTDSDADNELCKDDSVKFSVTGNNSIKFQLYKNNIAWLKKFRPSITSNDIKDGDLIKVMGTDTTTGCSDTSAPVKFGVTYFSVGLTCSDTDLIICSNVNITFKMSGASTYKLYKNNKFWTAPASNPITLFGINNNDEIYAEGTTKVCKYNSIKLKFKVSTPTIGLKIDNACVGDSVKLSFSGGVKYDLYKNSVFYKTINAQTYASKVFANNDNLYLDGTDSYGCSAYSSTLTVNYKTPPTITLNNPDSDNTTCPGENVTFNFNGGATYDLYKNNTLWKTNTGNPTSFTDASDKDEFYAIGFNSNGCRNTSNTVKLTVLALPSIDITNPDTDNTTCEGEKVTVNFSGGAQYDLYKNGSLLKSNAASPYTFSGLNNNDEVYIIGSSVSGCFNTSKKIKFTILTLPTVTISNPDTDNSHCKGDNVVINFSGGATYDLFKNNVIWKTNTGNSVTFNDAIDKDEIYSVAIGSNGCIDTSNKIKFTVWPLPAKPTITKSGTVLSSSYTTGNQWYEGTTKLSSATFQNYSPVKTATYFVEYTDAHGCVSPLSDGFSYSAAISKIKLPGLKIYPNPASDYLIIETGESGKFHLSLIDITGKLIKEETFTGNRFEWQLKPAKGIYTLKIVNEKGERENVVVEFK